AMAQPSSRLPRERSLALAYLAQQAGWRWDFVAGDNLGAMVLGAYTEHGWKQDTLYANALSWRGIALGMLGRTDEAEAHHAEALALARQWEPGGGRHYSNLLNNIATYYANIDEHARAEPLLLEVIEIDRRIYGPGHPQLAIAYNNLAS